MTFNRGQKGVFDTYKTTCQCTGELEREIISIFDDPNQPESKVNP